MTGTRSRDVSKKLYQTVVIGKVNYYTLHLEAHDIHFKYEEKKLIYEEHKRKEIINFVFL